MRARTDRHNNPTAFTTEVAKQAGLVEGVDYERGDPFQHGNKTLYTARLLKDPIETTIQVLDRIGFYTRRGARRWDYIGIPEVVWARLPRDVKVLAILTMYRREGGVELRRLFPTE